MAAAPRPGPVTEGAPEPLGVSVTRSGVNVAVWSAQAQVRAFTARHPAVPEALRGTFAALSHPAVIAHLKGLGVTTLELLPVAAWIDERHLPPVGLTNAWGYNPVALLAPDPRLAPGGW